MNEETKVELEHLIGLMAPPFKDNFKAFCWDKALRLAKRPEFAELPELLKERMTQKD